jgi:BirA family biotin operon repressor/biotin-[acetyl-CoA-carboxylase] ligase
MLGLAHTDRLTLIAELYTAIQQASQWFEHGSYNLAERFNHHAIWLNQQVEFEHAKVSFKGVFKASPMMVLYSIKTDHVQPYQGRLRLAQFKE